MKLYKKGKINGSCFTDIIEDINIEFCVITKAMFVNDCYISIKNEKYKQQKLLGNVSSITCSIVSSSLNLSFELKEVKEVSDNNIVSLIDGFSYDLNEIKNNKYVISECFNIWIQYIKGFVLLRNKFVDIWKGDDIVKFKHCYYDLKLSEVYVKNLSDIISFENFLNFDSEEYKESIVMYRKKLEKAYDDFKKYYKEIKKSANVYRLINDLKKYDKQN
ncbi:MAG TPA: hypothetical protein PLM63_03715 [bacterium]|nr:MAG: hypothetical protein BWX56_01391 [Euryarchaeota archaeon ADurb.Bin023]HPO11665.1 hypothetical protein [bacterium]